MYSLVLSRTPGKGGPSELEEPEEASSLYRKEAKKLEIVVKQKNGNPKMEERGVYSTRRRIAGGALGDPHRGAWSPPFLQEDLGFLLKKEERRLCS